MARTTSVRCDRCLRLIGRDASVFSARCEDMKTILHNVPPAHAFDLCLGCTTEFVEWVTRGRAEALPPPSAQMRIENAHLPAEVDADVTNDVPSYLSLSGPLRP